MNAYDILKGVRDWRVVDSMTVKLPMALKEEFPGTDDYAALKVHKEYSLGAENLVAYSVSPAREHDAPHLVHATMLGTLLANAFVREHHILQGQVSETRKSLNVPPLHPIAAAEMIARGGPVDEIVKNAPESTRLWERWAAIIVAVSADPSWRRRPSAMDVVKGRTCWLMDSHRYALDPKAEIGRAATRSSKKRRFVA